MIGCSSAVKVASTDCTNIHHNKQLLLLILKFSANPGCGSSWENPTNPTLRLCRSYHQLNSLDKWTIQEYGSTESQDNGTCIKSLYFNRKLHYGHKERDTAIHFQ
jgi:hypothetical protein